MGAYQLSLQGGSYNPAARLEASQGSVRSSASSQDGGCSHGRKSRGNSPVHGFGFFQSKRVASQQTLEGLLQPSPPRHSTACCDGLSQRREVERRLSSQKMKVAVQRDSSEHSSFRSEDSESLALWEEKEPASADHGWMKQSPRWLGAMRRFGRSSSVHPKCSSRDTPRVSLDREPSQRSLHDASSKPLWYAKKIRSGESRSVRSPTGASNLLRRTGELVHPSQYDHDDSIRGSFSRLTDEDTRFTASAVAWDISSRHDSLVAQPRSENGLEWEIPADASHEKFVDANLVKASRDPLHSVTDKSVVTSDGEQCEAFFDGLSEFTSCGTFANDGSHSTPKSAEFVNVIDFVAPLVTKPVADAASATPRVPFKWEARQGKRSGEVAPATETPQPPSFLSKDGFSSFESPREQYIVQSKSAPLDGLYVLVPETRPPRVPLKEDSTIPDSFLMKSRSSSDAEGRAAHDYRLFTKLRNSVFGSSSMRGPSALGLKNEFVEPSSPRSILRGPDDGSVPSSNPSLRSDPGTPASSAIPNCSTSQSMSSCSASFDLNEYDTTYDLNSTEACIIVESRRVSLSFRDFGPARPSDDLDNSDDVSEPTIELEQFNATGLGSLPESMQSPELWTATFSARYSDAPESPRCSSAPDQPAPSQQHEVQVPIVIEKSRSRNGEFTARLGVMFSPLRLISSHESNPSCFVASTLSPPHEVEDRSPTYAPTLEFLPTSELHFSSKGRKAKSSWTHGEKAVKTSNSSTRRHSSDDSQTMMVSISKAMKKILAKITVKRSTGKGKSKMGSSILETLPPARFHFTEVN